jgi:hypothetical protein
MQGEVFIRPALGQMALGAALGALALAWYLVAPRKPEPQRRSRLYLASVNGALREPPQRAG